MMCNFPHFVLKKQPICVCGQPRCESHTSALEAYTVDGKTNILLRELNGRKWVVLHRLFSIFA